MIDNLRRENKANRNNVLMYGEILRSMQIIDTPKPMNKGRLLPCQTYISEQTNCYQI